MRGLTLLLLAMIALCTGCTNVIIPPHDLQNPRMVYLLESGRHSSLLLPDLDDDSAEPSFTEYAYGDWQWFAHRNTGWYRVMPTLFWPTQGTIGRNTSPLPEPIIPSPSQGGVFALVEEGHRLAIVHHFGLDALYPIWVEAEHIEALHRRLDERYEDSAAASRFVPEYRLTFVPDSKPYTAFHNCNHEVLAWLRDLGCETRGTGMFSLFRVENVNPVTRKDAEDALRSMPEGLPERPIPSSAFDHTDSTEGGTE